MKRISAMILVLPVVSLVFFSCKKNDPPPPIPPTDTISAVTYLNVPYGSDGLQKMDIYLPKGRSITNTKIVLLIHGGGWKEGDKSEMTPLLDSLRQRKPEYAYVNINYRLAALPNNLYPTAPNDVKAAIDFILSKNEEYKISKKTGLLGGSAGGHLALLHAYKNNLANEVKCVISLFGPTELHTLYNFGSLPIQLTLFNFIGNTSGGNVTAYTEASPYNYITAQTPPTLMLHGTADLLVPVQQSRLLKTKLDQLGVINQLVEYPGLGHGDWPTATIKNALDNTVQFLTVYLQ
jgi:acetyl esterase/lipase